jgi:radical SAM superfamily enzyme YgiQ (UPF0313 family)
MRARVLLIYPPSRSQSHGSCPAALTMLAAALEQAGHEVSLLDANACANRRDRAAIVREATKVRPDVIGVTLVTPLAREAYRLAADLRPLGAKLLSGGPHATLLPLEPVAHGFDANVVGEGEPAIAEAVEALLGARPLASVAGLVYRDEQGTVRANPPRPAPTDLDALPAPARHLVDPLDYGGDASGELHMNVFSSRGCPAKCSYCAGGLFGRRFRFRSAKSVVDEMIDVHRRYGTRTFHFMDDAMTVNRGRVVEICDRLVESGLGLRWSIMTRVDRVDEELLRTLRRGGCVQIDYGIESGDPDTLKKIHKPHTVEQVRRVVPMTAAAGIAPYVFFILGFPWDTPETIEVTASLMRELAPHVAKFDPAIASVLIPFPATELYEKYKDQFGFAEWWLDDARCYDAPDRRRHAFFEAQAFPRGAALDADFFGYSPEVRRKIVDVVELMWRHNLRARRGHDVGLGAALARPLLFDLSRRLHEVSPPLERAVFRSLDAAKRFARVGA